MSKKEFPFVTVKGDLTEFENWNFNRKYGNMADLEARDKARLIKEALKIVDELADLEITDIPDMEDLIEKAEKLKKDRLWQLH